MSNLYTPPGKAARSLLVNHGPLQVNQTDGGATPAQYSYRSATVSVAYQSPALPIDPAASSSPAFVDLSAGVLQASAYDEAVFDVQPLVVWNTVPAVPTISVTTTNSAQAYADIASCGVPFWLAVNVWGYNRGHLAYNRDLSLQTALDVVGVLYSDLQSRQLLGRFLGFAFLGADLNVMFGDGTVIDRTFQSTLIQQCWGLGVGACMVTARPSDHLSLIAPVIAPLPPVAPSVTPTLNPNSGALLAHPLLGCNLAIRDKIVISYPLDQSSAVNGTVVAGQLAALIVPNNRDPGVTPNLDVAYVVPHDDSMWSVDGAGGVTPSSAPSQAAQVLAFAAAYGVTSLGLLNAASSTDVPAPVQFMPQDALVNATGKRAAWASGGSLFVAYGGVDVNGNSITVQRQFSPALVETTPSTAPALQ